jgi:hypothetical protein
MNVLTRIVPGMCAGKGRGGRKRVGLSLHVARANSGLGAEGLAAGLALAACVRSVEDHGFLLSLGVKVLRPQLGIVAKLLVAARACYVLHGK